MQHSMPAGTVVVPADPVTGERKVHGYEFHYTGWKQTINNPTLFRDGATKGNMFPAERKGRLDKDLLKKMGLTQSRMENNDALFFHQLLIQSVTLRDQASEEIHVFRIMYRGRSLQILTPLMSKKGLVFITTLLLTLIQRSS